MLYHIKHGLRTPREEIAFTARPKIHSHSQIFRYGGSIFCLSHRPNFSDIFDLCLHWVSVVRALNDHISLTTTLFQLSIMKMAISLLFGDTSQGIGTLEEFQCFLIFRPEFRTGKIDVLRVEYMKTVLVWYFSTLLFRKADGFEIIQKFNGDYLRLTGTYLISQLFSD